MPFSSNGSFRLFRVFGIDVYLHWSWLLVAVFQVQYRGDFLRYQSAVWNWIEYLTLFGIVLLHEFGHALACRQVGGIANRIILWPLGGIAYVNPPPQPGPVLWSIAAGPLVNVVLVVPTVVLWRLSVAGNWAAVNPDLALFLYMVMWMNAWLLILNLLPIYPLDGGQIFQALLWFVIGRANSLMVVSILGIAIGGVLILPVLYIHEWWLALIVGFVIFRAIVGFRQAQMLSRLLAGPRHRDAACPSCGTAPLAGLFWTCDQCGTRFDLFTERGRCPNCFALYQETKCPDCYKRHPIRDWITEPHAPAGKAEV